ncbi:MULTISPECIES: outer membrane protein transport protein [Vibrio]|uniref:outer membrane protein transport protein n=1 Tax=Vibrio TaxID=662 RepID=UPI0001B93BA3|nr:MULTISPECIES: outer membrane protein transport protein [Vibrio]EEX33901.1 long-chain fatty acid transport protein [Vibrio coralliilyticus ATCC BAA-450]MCM5510173.1 outer membrane protein transport protein [Vibrio sp. SCSIO 43169]MDE3899086.1 outer membrane protein transport protein [Vibrio sp. CC007]QFT35703.1 Long-chain fatty acid transport protein precursor [Vibrio sp. THAF64]QGM33603.1 Long-chain fatty acid transport protein precursor [Vibrio sp. THAF191d]
MNKTRLFKKSLLAVTIATTTMASQQALAAGFQLNAQSATGLGRAFAGDAVIADNASSMARNPATMALFDEMSLSLGFVSITSQIEVKDAQYRVFNGTGYTTSASNYDDAGDTSIAPNIHLIVPVNDKFAWGVNAYTNFGTKTEFDSSFAASEYGGLTDVKSMNLGVAGSYRLNEQWSFGAGIDFIYGEGKLQRTASPTLSSVLTSGASTSFTALDTKADGWAVGFNVGTVYEMDDKNRFGFSYRYSPDLEAEGDITKLGTTYTSDTLHMPLPDMAEFSGYHRLNDKYAVHYSVQWINWSEFDKLVADKAGDINDYKWQNGMHYAIGGTYYLNQDWTLRAGYMHDTSAQDQVTSISVPDSDRNWLSAGFTYHLDEKSDIDFGFTYLMGEDVKVEETTYSPTNSALLLSEVTGTTRADAILLGLQYSRSF